MSFEKEKGAVGMTDEKDQSTVKDVQSANLAEAILKEKPNPWTKRMFMASSPLQVVVLLFHV